MKKKTMVCAILWLLGISVSYAVSVKRSAATPAPTLLLEEALFIQVVRDMELLNSWLTARHYPQETIATLSSQYHQDILNLYKIDPQSFQESLNHYLGASIERTLQVYAGVSAALEALLLPS